MKVRPEERGKVIVLMILVVLVFGFVGYTLFNSIGPGANRSADSTSNTSNGSSGTSPQPSPTSGGTPQPAAPANTTMVAAAGSPNDYATLGRTGPVAPYSDVNPFKPPVEPTPPPSNPPPTRPVQPSTNTNTASALPSGPWLPNTGAVRPSNPAPPVRQDEPPLPLITLKGIVTGNPVIAILETNGQTQYRQTGETVTPGVRIGKISETSVVMELKGKRPVTLEVGRSIGGAPASAVPGGSTQPPPTSDPVPAAKPVVPEASSEPSASSITASAEPVKKPVRRYRRRAAPVRFVGRRL